MGLQNTQLDSAQTANYPLLSDEKIRNETLDFLRGIAILGMLVANVPWHVGNSMSRVIEPSTSSITAWLIQYLVFDSRFLPIFCFLFGAGFWILLQRSETFRAFYPGYLKRMLVLFMIGVAHAYLLWSIRQINTID